MKLRYDNNISVDDYDIPNMDQAFIKTFYWKNFVLFASGVFVWWNNKKAWKFIQKLKLMWDKNGWTFKNYQI